MKKLSLLLKITLTAALFAGIWSAVRVSADVLTYGFGSFYVQSADTLNGKSLFGYDVKYEDGVLYINTSKHLDIGYIRTGSGDSVAIEGDADVSLTSDIRATNGKPAIFVKSGASLTITPYHNYSRVTLGTTAGSAIHNEGRLNINGMPNLTVNGGENGAGIGGSGIVTIMDSRINATGGENGAGIGGAGAAEPGFVNIIGSEITAVGGGNAAGIGGGNGGKSNTVYIENSRVTALGGANASGIGGGYGGNAGNTYIYHSVVTAAGADNACGIGLGANGRNMGKIVLDGASSVKSSRMGCPPENANGDLLALNKIDNADLQTVLIDGEPFLYRDHFGEKAVYAYLTQGTHRIYYDMFTVYPGDFVVKSLNRDASAAAALNYDKFTHTLTVQTDSPIEIANKDPHQPTKDRIVIANGVAADVTLAGVNIASDGAAFEIAYNSAADVTVTLKDGTDNRLSSGVDCAGLQKSQDCFDRSPRTGERISTGTLTIRGGGDLYAKGGPRAAGIGSGTGSATQHIVIESGSIRAEGGINAVGLGGARIAVHEDYFACGDIVIRGGDVTVIGGADAPALGSSLRNLQKKDTAVVVYSAAFVDVTPGTDSANGCDMPVSFDAVKDAYGRSVVPFAVPNTSGEQTVLDNIPLDTDRSCHVFATPDFHSVRTGDAVSFYRFNGSIFVPYTVADAYDTGDFTVSGGTAGEDYYFLDHVLYIRSPRTPLTVANTDPDTATTDRIVVRCGLDADITLAGLNIEANRSEPAIEIEAGAMNTVTLTLAEDAVNLLAGGEFCAAVHKIGGAASGTLRICGDGTLYAVGGYRAAAIGCDYNHITSNIVIDGGCVTAIGGAQAFDIGKGYGYNSSEQTVVISKEASVRAASIGCVPSAMVDGVLTDAALYVIDNPEGKDVYINGEKLPVSRHREGYAEEDCVYTYLPAGTYGIRLGDGEEEEITVSTDTGDFIVGGQGTSFADGVLTVNTTEEVVISNKDMNTPTGNTIFVPAGINANITLAGVNIKPTANFAASIRIDDAHTGKVTVKLAGDTVNTVSGGRYAAAIMMQNEACTLTIKGDGYLDAVGGSVSAAIGAGINTLYYANAAAGTGTIRILGGNITAVGKHGNPGIGQASDGDATASVKRIVISETASVNAVFGKQPENENGEDVYPYMIENPDGREIFIDGKAFPFTDSGKDTNVYVCLPPMCVATSGISQTRTDHKIAVGDRAVYTHFDGSKWVQTGTFEIKANDRVYDGTEQNAVSVIGAPASGTTIRYAAEDGAYSADIPTVKNAGTYTVRTQVSDLYGTQYSFVEVTVGKAPLTVTAKPNTITYGDEPDADGVTFDGFVGGEDETVLTGTLGFVMDYEKWDDAGVYAITPSGLAADNYEIIFADGELTVVPKELTAEDVSVIGDGSFLYDGGEHSVLAMLEAGRGGCGNLTVRYTKNGTDFVTAPCEIGTYEVYVGVSGGTNYLASSGNGINLGKLVKIVQISANNSLLLNTDGRTFAVMVNGKDRGTGIVAAALYESGDENRLVELMLFDLSKGETPQGTFAEDGGYIKVFWWDGLGMKPLCSALGKNV